MKITRSTNTKIALLFPLQGLDDAHFYSIEKKKSLATKNK